MSSVVLMKKYIDAQAKKGVIDNRNSKCLLDRRIDMNSEVHTAQNKSRSFKFKPKNCKAHIKI